MFLSRATGFALIEKECYHDLVEDVWTFNGTDMTTMWNTHDARVRAPLGAF
jgi:hypothetical protein